MSPRLRRTLWLLPLGLPLLFVALLWLLAYWLESAGGRRMVEQRVGEAIGMPVTLGGDFGVRLLPRIGVTGSNLVIGGPVQDAVFARSERFAISIALRPLLRRELIVEGLSLVHGSLYPGNYQGASGPVSTNGELVLPVLREVTLRDFTLVLGADDGLEITITQGVMTDFATGPAAPFTLEIEDYGRVEGALGWAADPGRFELTALWQSGWGELETTVDYSVSDSDGELKASLRLQELADPLRLELGFVIKEAGVSLSEISLGLAAQSASGWACLLTGPSPSAHIALHSKRLDLDNVFPAGGNGSSPEALAANLAWNPPLALNARLQVTEFHAAGAVVRGAVFSTGVEPDCSALRGNP
ncbi:MAG: hypothetical protein RQ826_01675 [Xanthomonadales bacterium]|nr:hypothetical protein [Xanthomonadales bacterium]